MGSRTRARMQGLTAPLVAMAVAGSAAGCGESPSTASAVAEPDPVEASLVARATALPSSAGLQEARALLWREIERGAFPGAVLAAGTGGRMAQLAGYGRVGWTSGAEPADPERTLYDLASLTKVVGTTTAVMLLVEDGRMELDAPVSRYLPEFAGGDDPGVTIRQLLTHTGGIRAGFDPDADSPAEVRRRLISLPPTLKPGSDVLYSDVGFVILWAAAERAAGEPLPALLHRRVFQPLGMRSTVFGPPTGCPRCAPTMRLRDGEPYRGGSYDHTARRLEGRAGNAGLFSTGRDLGRFAAMIAAGGVLDGVRVLEAETIRTFLRAQPGAGTRALGWQQYCREGVVPDWRGCGEAYGVGHTGVTGTSLWLEPGSGTWVVLLTNRVYEPRAEVDIQSLRREVFERVAGITPRAAHGN